MTKSSSRSVQVAALQREEKAIAEKLNLLLQDVSENHRRKRVVGSERAKSVERPGLAITADKPTKLCSSIRPIYKNTANASFCPLTHRMDTIGQETLPLRRLNSEVKLAHIRDESKFDTLVKENANLSKDLTDSKVNESQAEENAREIRGFLLRAEEDKKRLSQRIDKLTANERVLVLEIERLRKHNKCPQLVKSGLGGKKISQLEEHISGLEQDRDYWCGQVELLTKILACPAVASSVPKKSASGRPSRVNSFNSKTHHDSRKAKIEEEIKQLQLARNELKQQLNRDKIRSDANIPNISRSRSLTRVQPCDEAYENQKLRLERDELQMMLNRFETRVQEIQGNVQNLTKERDDLHKLYNEARNEIHRLHHDVYDMHSCGDRAGHISQEVMARLETDNKRAQSEVTRLTAERDIIVAKYKKVMEIESADKQRHSKQMDYLEKALKEATAERDEVMGRITGLRRKLEELQCNQMQIEQRLVEKQEKLKKSSEEVIDARRNLDLKQRRVEEMEAKLTNFRHRNKELEAVCAKCESLTDDATRRLQMEREETARLQMQIELLSDERTKLQLDLDEMLKAKASLQKNNMYLEKKYLTAACERDEMTTECQRMSDNLKDLESKFRAAETEAGSWASKFQLERAANEDLVDRCSATERRLESAEMRVEASEADAHQSQDALYQLERQLKSHSEQMDWLKANMDRSAEENNNLTSTVELANKDKVKLEACIEELQTSNRQLVRDRDDLVHRHSLARERVSELESEVRALESEVKRNVDAARSEHLQVSDLRKICETSREQCDRVEMELVEMTSKYRDADERLRQAELRANQLERELRLEHDDYTQIRARLDASEEQKENQEAHLKSTAQRLSDLEHELTLQLKETNELKSALDESGRKLARQDEQLQTGKAEQQSLLSELAAAQSGLRESRRTNESAENELSRMREELSTLSRDLHRLESAHREVLEDREDLKHRLESYLSEIARLERIQCERDREREVMAEQMRAANEDAEIWRGRWEKAENTASAVRAECDERELEMARQRDALDAKEREIIICRDTLSATEAQAQDLTKAACDSNEIARMARSEIDALTMEISRLRDSLYRTEGSRSVVDRELANTQLDMEQLRTTLEDTENELARFKDQAAAERENVRSIHGLLQTSREKEHGASIEAQEKTNEMILLRERVLNAEERADAQQKEAERLMGRLAEMEREAIRLSRSLSTERFEKERILAEMRLNSSMAAPYRPSAYPAAIGLSRFTSNSMSRIRTSYKEKDDS